MSENDVGSGSPAHQLVQTLQDAHEQVARWWPGRHASSEEFQAYYEQAARLYEQVSETDPDHRHEAVFWAQRERENAQESATGATESTISGEPAAGAESGGRHEGHVDSALAAPEVGATPVFDAPDDGAVTGGGGREAGRVA